MMNSFADLHATLKRKCEKVDDYERFSGSQAQIDYILSNYFDIQNEYKQQVVPIFDAVLANSKKSLDEAEKYKRFFETLKNLPEPHFVDGAFAKLNEAIMTVPHEERNYLLILFAHRSSMHYHRQDYPSALKDIDHALQIRLSYSLIERKVAILGKLNRLDEAYTFLEFIIENKKDILPPAKYKLFRKLWKKLKKYQPSSDLRTPAPDPVVVDAKKITIDSRVEITKNQAQRYSFIAKEAIPSETEFLAEVPLILTLRNHNVDKYCNNCHSKATNIFWPCSQCREVVFCSKDCAEQADYHKAECGMVNLMQRKISNQSVQVYRTFAHIGMANLAKFEKKLENFSFTECCKNLEEIQADDSTRFEWFIMNQGEIFKRIERYKPLRYGVELCNAICLFMIYCYKINIDLDDWNRNQIVQAIDYLATNIVKTQINEYCWNDVDEESHEKIQIGNFQCLFGSSINHNCDPNASWSFDGKKFLIKTNRDVAQGEELAITYGVSKDSSLIKRQRHLQNFYVMCYCSRCAKDVRRLFAIRCNHCNGPTPYDSQEFQNEMCMSCERKYGCLSTMSMVQNRYQSARRVICMIGQVDDEEFLKVIEDLMSTLASYIYLQYEPFIQMVQKFCERYFELEMWSPAIEWYQWFRDCAEMDLSWNEDPIVHYANLDKWTTAYTRFLQEEIQDEQLSINKYADTAADLFQKQFKKLETLENDVSLQVMDMLQLKKFAKKSLIELQAKYSQFKKLSKEISNSISGSGSGSDYHLESASVSVTGSDEEQQLITDQGANDENDDQMDKVSRSSRTFSSEMAPYAY